MDWIKEIEIAYDAFSMEEVFRNEEDISLAFREHMLKQVELHKEKNSKCENMKNLGISCLQVFVSENWTGPALTDQQIPEKIKYLFSKGFAEIASSNLQCDGEMINNCCSRAGLFWIAYIILVEMIQLIDPSNPRGTICAAVATIPILQNDLSFAMGVLYRECRMWTLRCLSVYEELLDEKSLMLNEKFLSVAEKDDETQPFKDRETEVQFHLECAHLYLHYYGYSKANEHLERARDILGFDVFLTGSLGKRTKFQENELAQLRLEVKSTTNRERCDEENSIENTSDVPKDVTLDDDTLLSSVNYIDAARLPLLKPIEQAYVITASILLQRTTAKDNLLAEELLPYVEAVTQKPQAWSVQCKALYQRSLLQSKGKRTVERSMMQMQQLVDEFKKEKPEAGKRLYLVHAIALPPQWKLQADFARILLTLGCTKSALEIFEKIEAWEDVILCYQRLGRHEKAENVIRQQLEIKESAKLWCLLGDVTNNIEFYDKAWQFSNKKSARAQRSLGFWYLRSGKVQDCIPYFQKSLEISSLQPQVWFSLGCAGLATKQFDIAQKAFQRYVTIDPDNHEAWNNLSSVFIRTNQKRKAFKALQEALKANYGSWQIWENFLLVAVDLGEFKAVIRAIHTLLELKKKHIDVEVLQILVRCATSDVKDATGDPVSKLIPKIKELFGRITAQITNNPEVWLLYGDLYLEISETDNHEKALNFYLKAQRCYIQNSSWEKDKSHVEKVIETHQKLLQATQKMSVNPAKNITSENQLIASSRMAVSNFLKRFDIIYPDGLNDEYYSKVQEMLQTLRKDFEVICK